MSRVILLAADHPMPLYDPDLRRISVSNGFTVEVPGFSVQDHEYYRDAVDSLGLEMKPFQYELNLDATDEDAEQLRTYLETNGTRANRWSYGTCGWVTTAKPMCPTSAGSLPTWTWTRWTSCAIPRYGTISPVSAG